MIEQSDSKSSARVAFLGPAGTFSHVAVMKQFGDACQLIECASIDKVFAAVGSRDADYGVVPVENSTEGAINNTQDCLLDSDSQIIGEQIVLIEHNLLAQKGVDEGQIKTVVSHEQSLAQCRNWLATNLGQVKQIECASNAEAAKIARGDGSVAAIAGQLAARIYDLDILQASIQDRQHNSTRFLVLANSTTKTSGNDKTSILVYTENKPGALFRILEPFERLQVSLTKIETRPSKKEAWEYVFFIDFEGHVDDENVQELFGSLELHTAEIKILGSYPRCSSTAK